MKFGSWTYDGFRLDLVPEGHPEGCDGDIKKFIRHGEWDLISMPCSRNEVIYKCCPEPYPDITYTMDLRRRHMFYFVNMIAPCFLISGMWPNLAEGKNVMVSSLRYFNSVTQPTWVFTASRLPFCSRAARNPCFLFS